MAYDFVEKAEKAKSALIFPQKVDYTTTWWYNQGKAIAKQVAHQIPEVFIPGGNAFYLSSKELDKDYKVKEKAVDLEAYRQAEKEYSQQLGLIFETFEKDLAKYIGVPYDHPKWNKLMELSTEFGGKGLANIAETAETLSDLMTKEL